MRLQNLVSKFENHNKKTWKIYQNANNMMYLHENGAVLSERDIVKCKENIALGNMKPTWFYFQIKKDSPIDKLKNFDIKRHDFTKG